MLFDPSTVKETKGFVSLLPKCGACGLLDHCNTPKMEVDGDGRLKTLIVGESPGEDEDRKGRPFVGKSGQLVAATMRRYGLDMRRDCWITNSVICHPEKNATNKRHVEWCRPNLIRTIKELKPKVIILLGGFATQSFMSYAWKERDGNGITQWSGWRIPCRDPDAWVCPTFHPARVLRSQDDPNGKVIEAIFNRHMQRACKLMKKKESPWNGNPPDESKRVATLLSPKEAAWEIKKGMSFNKGELTSFDYETNMLKPWGSDAEIVSCSICFGEKGGNATIAYPWHGRAIDETIRYLKSGIPKAGANIKFEQTWTMAKCGTRVKNFVWDSVNQAHVLDHRPGITSVKFQSFVRFGTPAWDAQVSPYLKRKEPDKPNRIRECDLETLLIYNGIDSLVEYQLALAQSKVVGIKLPGVK